jgi:hypothetical protein
VLAVRSLRTSPPFLVPAARQADVLTLVIWWGDNYLILTERINGKEREKEGIKE